MDKTAAFSEDRVYRYTLTRTWGTAPPAAFIGLNPSTADETLDDPTIRRCIGFARAWGCGGITMLNIFAFRATDPNVMKAHPEPVGAYNDFHLMKGAATASVVVACWGVHGTHLGREIEVRELFTDDRLFTFGLTKAGHPKHPLYLSKTSQLEAWDGP